MSDDLRLILDAAREAGELARDIRRKGLEVEYKADDHSPVTNADLAADDLLTRRLRAARPDYGWLSEETADDPQRMAHRRIFVVDPIDGTRAFLKGRPWWSVAIAVVDDGVPTAAAVYAPELEEIYAAAAGQGATRNGAPIAPTAAARLEEARMAGDPVVFAHWSWPTPWPATMSVEQRSSTAYRMCAVAAGEFDAAVAPVRKSDWDVAAGDLIAREAGCFVGDHTGEAFRFNRARPSQASLICSTRALAPLILERLQHMGPRN
ncbi:MAG: 3'(2'),5'-bisphosphate nucleotidase CysQ [Phenylobacterium sp.]|uniref:3'(2'),5'-bisphosphate nucleotidase CysQ n=1 Tax=Phenylobacterium sp. TaxID=1871053 RepID=UPI001A36BD7D|nr:3'(2'),5'-bisphosphate nucleotidase CysQ [Phenylobacterium sp.]MBL8772115.1 3'(2'),5'-bisphosphate nucleotidase CysQ [Phenylobacterium sp.]